MNLSISYAFARGLSLPRGEDFNIANSFDPNFCSGIAPNPGVSTGQTCNGLAIVKSYDIVNSSGTTQQTFSTPYYSSAPLIASSGAGTCVALSTTCVVGVPSYSGRIDPRTGLLNGNSSTADTRYNGLIISLRKQMSHGLEVVGNYTFSHATDNGAQSGVNGGGEGQVGIPAIDPLNLKPEVGNSGTDVRNRFTASVVYAPRFAKNFTNKAAKEALDGWSISSSVIAQNGNHYTGQIQGSTPPTLAVKGYTPGSTALSTYTFTALDGSMGGAGINSPGNPLAGRIGWMSPGSFVLPNLYNLDLRLEKQFAIHERYHIAIRGEAFNLFNTTLIQAVSQNAYAYASPAASTTTTPTPSCWNGQITSGGGPVGPPPVHTNTCMTAISNFGQPSTTSGNLLGARQMQAGIRFEF